MGEPTFSLQVGSSANGVPVLTFHGYYSQQGGEAVEAQVAAALDRGQKNVILDLTKCTIINSPGIAKLMDVVMKVVDDFRGKLVLVGLDNSKKQFLTMTGVLPLATAVSTLAEAERAMSG
ncbi:MAG: hypothetical protein OZSIB_0755 [Candidatus Ozemobacter sibiricus]|jgi:anti-anti-sigma regulatory factor|uniref:STAS domain-containing protein n=1 Tax=Candidatus Ozemobacter sibiricus TaxID=2268124 RepID=A0A367ZWB8_9BACT|nr:MAG: hypothetical protein OZSIB_0755 [Candidatus Ozemobacter sibiricus]